MKTEFELETGSEMLKNSKIKIIGERPNHKPYVSILAEAKETFFIKDKDLERFAVNILKALKSKRLK